MENLIQKSTQSEPFIPKSGYFFWSQKGQGRPPLSLLVVHLWGWLNTPKYLWKCLNKPFWLCQSSEYAWLSHMFERLFKMPWVLNNPGFWIWHGCMRVTQSSEYIWLWLHMPKYTLISLSMPEHGWILVNTPEYAWKCLNKLFCLYERSQYTEI